jgi:hypothetical protein
MGRERGKLGPPNAREEGLPHTVTVPNACLVKDGRNRDENQ